VNGQIPQDVDLLEQTEIELFHLTNGMYGAGRSPPAAASVVTTARALIVAA
jgi:hypothetical protein